MPNIFTDDTLKQFTNPDHTLHYIQEIFKHAIDLDPAWMVEVRKIGRYRMDDGTSQGAELSVPAQLLQFDQFNPIPGMAQWVAHQVLSAAPLGIGAFMAPALLSDRRANDESVKLMVTVCADFDTGNPKQQLDDACKLLGIRPTIIATSGGITADGHHKLHAHWRLDEPCDEPWKIAYIREQLAKKFGADQSFKRIPQIIRIPGALYDKHALENKFSMTEIVEYNDSDCGTMAWEEALNIDWSNLDEESMFAQRSGIRTKEERAGRLHQLQTEKVDAGRTTDTRWDRFSEYAGHQIRQARFNHQSVEEAYKSTVFWVQDQMVPPWDEQRIDAEFRALLQKDKVAHADTWAERDAPAIQFGNTPAPAGANVVPQNNGSYVSGLTENKTQESAAWSIDMFDAAVLYPAGEAPKERHLIENFMVHGSSMALVADGGVGKTYISLELALRAAAGPVMFGTNPNLFMGFHVLEACNAVVLTVEDSQADLHRRLDAIDPDGSLREAARGRCSIVPVQEQIMNGLTLAEKDNKNNVAASRAWKALLEHIKVFLEDVKRKNLPLLVVIDTYSATHHGDENAATGTNEWFRAAGLLRQFEATLMVTHHVRKTDPNQEIRTPSDMKAAVRGSSAFLNAVRSCYGIWEMPNADAVLKELPREKGDRLFNMGILKNNTGISWEDRSDPRYPEPMITLRRGGNGRLFYDAAIHMKRIELTNSRKERLEASRTQLKAAIIHVVRWYAEQGWPLTRTNLVREKAQYLPDPVRAMPDKNEIDPMISRLLADGVLKQLKVKKTNGMVLDVPDGPYASAKQEERRPDTPTMQWAWFKYDEENEEYAQLPNMQHAMDF